jgi:hypothetical protein
MAFAAHRRRAAATHDLAEHAQAAAMFALKRIFTQGVTAP